MNFQRCLWVCVWSPHTAAGEDVGLCRVDGDAADVVSVSLEHVNSLQSVVVEHTDQHVILGNGHRDRETQKAITPMYLAADAAPEEHPCLMHPG